MGAAVMLIIGPGGCGKTHRLEALAAAHEGAVARVRGTRLDLTTEFGALRPLLDGAVETHHAAAAQLAAALGPDTLLLVDDAHHLDVGSVAALAALVGQVPHLAVAHRHSDRVDLATLDQALAESGSIERVSPMAEAELGAVLAELSGSAVDGEYVASLVAFTGGVPGLAIPLAGAEKDDLDVAAGDHLSNVVEGELTTAGPDATSIARVASLAPQLPDDVLASAASIDTATVRTTFDEFAAAGLLDPETSELWPATRSAVRSLMTSAMRRQIHERLASAVLERGGEVSDAAEHLLKAGTTGEAAADLYARAGDETRFREPDAALSWYEEARIAGGLSAQAAVGEIEAAAFAGQPILNRPPVGELTATARSRLVMVRAIDEARLGRPARSAQLFDNLAKAPDSGGLIGADTARLLAASMTAASTPPPRQPVDLSAPEDPLDGHADVAYRLAAACAAHNTDPQGSARRFVEAADANERLDPSLAFPDSAHAIGALHLASLGDNSGADLLLERAERANRTPMLDTRHRFLRAWVQLRAGRYELPVALLRERPEHDDIRDQLVFSSIEAGVARRNGDIARLRDAWSTAEPLLLAGTADLFHLEVIGELLLAAARMRHFERAEPTLAALEALAGGSESGPWGIAWDWLAVQLGIEGEDAAATKAAADSLRSRAAGRANDDALAEAAQAWAAILEVDDAAKLVDQVEHAAQRLAARGLPWEASRLAGQAAVRVKDANAARRLLEQARLHHRAADTNEPTAVSDAGLSERELEIARLVVDGLTHREVGAQLYISPKTVEHHVANIRRKVQAGSRAEMLAILRDLVLPPEA